MIRHLHLQHVFKAITLFALIMQPTTDILLIILYVLFRIQRQQQLITNKNSGVNQKKIYWFSYLNVKWWKLSILQFQECGTLFISYQHTKNCWKFNVLICIWINNRFMVKISNLLSTIIRKVTLIMTSLRWHIYRSI